MEKQKLYIFIKTLPYLIYNHIETDYLNCELPIKITSFFNRPSICSCIYFRKPNQITTKQQRVDTSNKWIFKYTLQMLGLHVYTKCVCVCVLVLLLLLLLLLLVLPVIIIIHIVIIIGVWWLGKLSIRWRCYSCLRRRLLGWNNCTYRAHTVSSAKIIEQKYDAQSHPSQYSQSLDAQRHGAYFRMDVCCIDRRRKSRLRWIVQTLFSSVFFLYQYISQCVYKVIWQHRCVVSLYLIRLWIDKS